MHALHGNGEKDTHHRRQRKNTKKARQHQPHIHDLRVAFLNVHGLGDARFRGYLLAQYRRRYDVLILVETWCPGPEEERAWAKDWHNSGGTFWASGPPSKQTTPAPHQQPAPVAQPPGENEDTHPHTHKGRGVAILFARELEAAATDPPTIIRDPAGRYLAVSCKIHGRDTMFIGAHADNKSDARQEAYYSRLYDALPPYNPSTDYHLFIDANNAPDWTLDRRGNPASQQDQPSGLPALRCILDAYSLADNF